MSTECANAIPIGGYTSHFLTNFDLLTCLGKGGFGVVFKAKHKIDNRKYAIKRITLPNSPESRERVMREVRALAKLDHPNIVRYVTAWIETLPPGWQEQTKFKFKDGMSMSVDVESPSETEWKVLNNKRNDNKKKAKSESIVFEHSNLTNELSSEGRRTEYLYMQMELCREQSLKEWLLDDSIKDRSTKMKPIFRQILKGVEYVHKQGLIHRDLKPSNIFFSLNKKIKIGDFGLVTAKASNFKTRNSGGIVLQSDKRTPQVGTTLYMSPEQSKGEYDCRVDIYSLGLILFELLVQFKTDTERIKTLENLKRNKFPSDFQQKFPNEFELLVLMLSEDPGERPTIINVRRTLFPMLPISKYKLRHFRIRKFVQSS